MSLLRLLPALSFPVLAACAGAPTAPAGPTCKSAGIAPAPLTGAWWEGQNGGCPAGATLDVTTKKDSMIMRMCTLAGGTQHGPFRIEDKGAVLSEGWYVHGKKHGTWRRYDGITSQYVVETYECDRVLERLPESPADAPAPAEGDGDA